MMMMMMMMMMIHVMNLMMMMMMVMMMMVVQQVVNQKWFSPYNNQVVLCPIWPTRHLYIHVANKWYSNSFFNYSNEITPLLLIYDLYIHHQFI